MQPTRQFRVCLGIFMLFMFAATYVHQTPRNCPTPLSRLDLLHALFVHGTLRIDAYDNTPDKATYEGHTYSDKAPATTALALPAFALGAGALKLAGIGLDTPTGWLASSWLACVGSIALIAALGAVALYLWLLNFVPPRPALITTLAMFLGAAPLPYATMLFSHALVVSCIAIALYAISRGSPMLRRSRPENYEKSEIRNPKSETNSKTEEGNAPNSEPAARNSSPLPPASATNRWPLLAGFSCGLALASEYTAGLVVVAIFLWLVFEHRRSLRPLAFSLQPFILGALPPLLLIPLYSWLCFGNPFILPYSLNESFPAMREGLYAIKWPDPETAYNLLLSPTRGLFFWTPFLAIALVGYWDLVRLGTSSTTLSKTPSETLSETSNAAPLHPNPDKVHDKVSDKDVGIIPFCRTSSTRLFWLTYAVPLLQVLIISGRVWDWQAGPTLGPRYLAPMLPLLAVPCALGVRRFPKIGLSLAAVSIALTAFAVITNASPPGSIYNPLTDLQWPAFFKGKFQPNLGTALGLPPHLSAALYFTVLALGTACLWRASREGEG